MPHLEYLFHVKIMLSIQSIKIGHEILVDYQALGETQLGEQSPSH